MAGSVSTGAERHGPRDVGRPALFQNAPGSPRCAPPLLRRMDLASGITEPAAHGEQVERSCLTVSGCTARSAPFLLGSGRPDARERRVGAPRAWRTPASVPFFLRRWHHTHQDQAREACAGTRRSRFRLRRPASAANVGRLRCRYRSRAFHRVKTSSCEARFVQPQQSFCFAVLPLALTAIRAGRASHPDQQRGDLLVNGAEQALLTAPRIRCEWCR